MILRPLHLALGAAIAGGLLLAACGAAPGPTGTDSAVVAYSVSDSGSVIVDDLSYDNGQGTLVLVTTPGSTYMNVRNLALPGSVEGILHGHGAGKLTFRAVWTIGNQTQGDSAVIVANHESFTLQIPHHSI